MFNKKKNIVILLSIFCLCLFGCSKPISQTNAGEVVLVGDIDFRDGVDVSKVDTFDDVMRGDILNEFPDPYGDLTADSVIWSNLVINNLHVNENVIKNVENRSDGADSQNHRFFSGGIVSFDFEDYTPHSHVRLDLLHLQSALRDQNNLLINGNSPITIKVNNQVVTSNFRPRSYNFVHDDFDITAYLFQGINIVEISLDDSAKSQYWLKEITVSALYNGLRNCLHEDGISIENSDLLTHSQSSIIDQCVIDFVGFFVTNDISIPVDLISYFTDSFNASTTTVIADTAVLYQQPRFFILASLVKYLGEQLGSEQIRDAISESRLEELQSFLYNLLSQNSGMVYKYSNLNMFDIFTINFRADLIEQIQQALNGYSVNGQDSFLSLAGRAVYSEQPNYQNVTSFQLGFQQFTSVAANVNRSWSELFEDALDVSILFYNSGVVLNENTLMAGEKLINPSLSFNSSLISGISSLNLSNSSSSATYQDAIIRISRPTFSIGNAASVYTKYYNNQLINGMYNDQYGWMPYSLLGQLMSTITGFNNYGFVDSDYDVLLKLYVFLEAVSFKEAL